MSTATPLESAPVVQHIPSDILWEEIDGQIVEKHMGAKEILLANDIQDEINAIARPGRSGRALVEIVFDFVEQVGHKRRPDVAFVSRDRWDGDAGQLPAGTDWKIVPNLAVEVVSPSNSYGELIDKKNEYFLVGVELVWIVVPSAREIHVYESATDMRVVSGSDTLTAEALLPGFELSLTELFGTSAANS